MRALPYATLALALLHLPAPAAADALSPCPVKTHGTGAECGHITVFEDRAAGRGRQIELEVIVLRASGPESERRPEPVFFLAGGPGQAATDLRGVGLMLAPVRRTRDLVFVDQRGTGDSNLLDCAFDLEGDPASAFGGLWAPEEIARCFEKASTHSDPGLYTTDLVADDLDQVRRRLGYERVILSGGSGGTRTALVWMRRHPETVLAAALDGVVPTDFRAPSGYARGSQEALDRVFADCAAQEDCAAAYPDLAADFDRVMALFDDGPVEARVTPNKGDPVTVSMHRGDFAYAVRGMLYSSLKISGLPRALHRAAESGDVSAFAQAYWSRSAAILPAVAIGVHLGVFCAEDVPFLDDLDLEALTRGTFVGDYLIDQYRAACDAWPIEPLDRAYLEPVASDVPVLLLSGAYDPTTPPSSAEAAAAHLPNSRHIVAPDEAHGAAFGCARQALLDFLKSGSLDGLRPACEEAGPIRFSVGD